MLFLIAGVAAVQLAKQEPTKVSNTLEQNRMIGFSAAFGACILSGFAGIYFEKMLKGADISVWMRNVQMSLLSIPLGLATSFISDFTNITTKGFFHGYDLFVVYLVLLQAGGGLLVAMVVKYADNILKGFATSLSIIISCVASIYLFEFTLTFQFAFGSLLVIVSIFLYGYVPTPPKTKASSVPNVNNAEDEQDREVHDKLVDKV